MRRLFLLLLLLSGPVVSGGELPSLREKLARMLIVSFDGRTPGQAESLLRKEKIGGVILFADNIGSAEELTRLCAALQAACDYPLLVTVDQEGGAVVRLWERDGYPPLPAAEKLGRIDRPDTTRRYAARTAACLEACGINVNFAPVVDLNTNPLSPAIGKHGRSFSADPATVVRHASAVIGGQAEHGILSVLKHFPGHGSAAADSHLGTADITATWDEAELLPYRELFARGFDGAVLVGHLYHAAIDPEYPASLSCRTITGLLRKELGWEGLVVTDDLGMGAITRFYRTEDAVRQAINAGADLLIVTKTDGIPQLLDALEEAARRGMLDTVNVNRSFERISRRFSE